jgi:hypothetical protein
LGVKKRKKDSNSAIFVENWRILNESRTGVAENRAVQSNID